MVHHGPKPSKTRRTNPPREQLSSVRHVPHGCLDTIPFWKCSQLWLQAALRSSRRQAERGRTGRMYGPQTRCWNSITPCWAKKCECEVRTKNRGSNMPPHAGGDGPTLS